MAGAMLRLLDRIGPPGRCSGCWRRPRRSQLRGHLRRGPIEPAGYGGRCPPLSRSRARELFLNSQGRRDAEAARPDRAAWAVQRLLAASAEERRVGTASRRRDRTSWRGGALTSFVTVARARAFP